MYQILAIVVLTVGLLAVPSATNAGKSKKTILTPGGNTIGGPAFGSIDNVGNVLTVFLHPAGVDLCATGVNVTKAGLVDFVVESSAETELFRLGGEQTRIVCLAAARIVRFECAELPCQFHYRVDGY